MCDDLSFLQTLYSKRGELEAILLNFVIMLGVTAVVTVPEWTFNNIITAWGWSAIGFLVVCGISFIVRKTKLMEVDNAPAEHN